MVDKSVVTLVSLGTLCPRILVRFRGRVGQRGGSEAACIDPERTAGGDTGAEVVGGPWLVGGLSSTPSQLCFQTVGPRTVGACGPTARPLVQTHRHGHCMNPEAVSSRRPLHTVPFMAPFLQLDVSSFSDFPASSDRPPAALLRPGE